MNSNFDGSFTSPDEQQNKTIIRLGLIHEDAPVNYKPDCFKTNFFTLPGIAYKVIIILVKLYSKNKSSVGSSSGG